MRPIIHRICHFWILLLPFIGGTAYAGPGAALQSIDMLLSEQNLAQWGVKLDALPLAQQVASNLAEWNFPLGVGAPYSHQLRAAIGSITHRETPVGFSFSSGNSDPRASDFQKADVLPIYCGLHDLASQKMIIERESTFSAQTLEAGVGFEKLRNKLIDLISTACLDVLEQAPTSPPEARVRATLFKPRWMPDVRVEVKKLPATVTGNPSPLTNEDSHKEIIIHNQGTPLIFHFGHER